VVFNKEDFEKVKKASRKVGVTPSAFIRISVLEKIHREGLLKEG